MTQREARRLALLIVADEVGRSLAVSDEGDRHPETDEPLNRDDGIKVRTQAKRLVDRLETQAARISGHQVMRKVFKEGEDVIVRREPSSSHWEPATYVCPRAAGRDEHVAPRATRERPHPRATATHRPRCYGQRPPPVSGTRTRGT